MPKSRPSRLLDPLKSTLDRAAGDHPVIRAAQMLAEGRARADHLRQVRSLNALPEADDLTPDHYLSRAFGLDRARRLLDPELEPRRAVAKERRARVLELSLAQRPVRDIANEVGLSPGYVVKVRRRLRAEGKLPRSSC